LGAVVVVAALLFVVVVVDADFVAVVVVTGNVVVVAGAAPATCIASRVAASGIVGLTPAGSKAMVTLMYSANLMDAGFVVIVGLVWPYFQ
jgi:hypothetical protein